ncbi:carbohydrate-binding domain-containing protein [Acholeplasma manati]|uniref:Carbohydrate-binding domain-containing protein n=1 Tax=Paracholeplasma manati TaxID=591373 RepID=A0ABT2Y553_9MOLU|nr:carbohydrate-binding domain-containing protein [Paracholeplasma manati]MCV2231880.1 carbohydrate-binding domain-containing protein [Paracholeplasma manati]
MKKIYTIVLLISAFWVLTACQSSVGKSIDIAVIADEHIELMIYEDEAFDQVINDHTLHFLTSEDEKTDETTTIYFQLIFEEGYELDQIVQDDTLLTIVTLDSDLGHYAITVPVKSSQITVTSKLSETTELDNAFEGTFILDDHVSVIIYETQTSTEGEESLIGVAKDGTTGEILIDGEGQINFKVVLDEGYVIKAITITPTNYKNLKLPTELGENTYRITKITSDITISITTKSINSTYNDSEPTSIYFSESNITVDNDNGFVSIEGNVVTITSGGSYYVEGVSSEGSLIINATDEVFDLVFGHLSLSSSLNAPIQILSADKVNIRIPTGIQVLLNDLRPIQVSESDDTPNAALYANEDLNLSGSGELVIQATYNNGIGTKDDLIIDGLSITVVSANHAIKGSDSITITSGTFVLTAQGGDGLKTSNSDVSSKGNQRGTITISGGTFVINAATDGIDAAYDVVIENNPTIHIYTSTTYASNVSTPVENTNDILYIRVPSNLYNANYRYAVYQEDAASSIGTWVNASLIGQVNISGRFYYLYEVSLDASLDYFTIYRFNISASNSTTTFVSKSEKAKWNDNYNMTTLSISGTSITYSFGLYATSGLEYSAKGIKADNEIRIAGGVIHIQSYDDAIHANNDVLLENGVNGTGNVTIQGGTIVITTKDDGIHADQSVLIAGGAIEIVTSYEGIEGNVVKITDGIIKLFSTDDGINATSGSLSPKVEVTGGYLEISVGTGDTDAIDSNGSYVQTGGFVVSMSALSGGMGGALDTDGSVSISGGTFIGIGSSEHVPSSTGNNRSTGSMTVSITPGTYVVKDNNGQIILTFTTSTYTYNRLFITSDQLKQGTSYTLYRGETSVKTWTLS